MKKDKKAKEKKDAREPSIDSSNCDEKKDGEEDIEIGWYVGGAMLFVFLVYLGWCVWFYYQIKSGAVIPSPAP